MTEATFDLTREPWLPVVKADSTQLMSLGRALTEAHQVEALDHAKPLVAAALYRMLMAMAIDLLPPLTSRRVWQAAFDQGQFDGPTVERYLAEHAHRLDLFHPETPFMQVAGLEATNGAWKPVSLLMPEVATGNNVPLFSSAPEAVLPPLTPAQAAQRLVALHAWDTAAIKTGARGDPKVSAGKTTGNPTGPAGSLGVVVPLGRTLYETLLLSCLVTPAATTGTASKRDRPAWRQPTATAEWSTRVPYGIRDLLTWQSRRVRLLPRLSPTTQDDTPSQTAWAAKTTNTSVVITQVVVAAGDRIELLPPTLEPHTMWRSVDTAKNGGPPQRPVRFQSGRATWRGIASLLATRAQHNGISSTGALTQFGEMDTIPDDYPLGVFTVGVAYGNQSAVVEDVMTDVLPVPVRALRGDTLMRSDLEGAVSAAEGCTDALNKLAGNLRRAAGGDPVPWDRGQRPGDRFLAGLNDAAQQLLHAAQQAPEEMTAHLTVWEKTLRARAWAIADPLMDDAPSATFLGREDRNGRFIRQATAEAFFRSALATSLPRAHPQSYQEA